MTSSPSLLLAPRHLRRATWLILLAWTLAVAASVVWNMRLLHDTMFEAAATDARSNFDKDLLYRHWATMHGGVYVPVTALTPPNPYLTNVLERDLVTPSGRHLTLINPSYMTRQVHELETRESGTHGRITSLKSLRPENAPDTWEAAALRAFEQGRTEVISREMLHGQPYLRLMKPLVTEAACLKCHAVQGYHEGDIRGGISIAVPLASYLAVAHAQTWPVAGAHAGLWALGLLGISLGARQLRQRLDERLWAEEALRRSETRFRTLYETTSDAVMLSTEEGFFDCNPATLAMFGCRTREELCSKHPADVSPPVQPNGADSLTLANQLIATAMEKGSHQFEWLHKRVDTGETFPAEVLLCALELDGKRVLQGSVRDITARKELEAQMERLRTEHDLILDSIGEGIHWVDVDGRIKYENPAAAKMLGYKVSELIGQPAHSTMHHTRANGAAYPKSECPIYATLRDGVARRVTDEVFWRKDGSSFAVEYLCAPVCDQNGRSGGSVVIFADITERKRAEDELREKEHFLSESQRLGHIGSWFYDVTGPMAWSEETYRIFGVSPDTCTPSLEALLGLIHPEDRPAMQAWNAACAAGEKPCPLEFRILLSDGTVRFIRGSGEAVLDAGGQLLHMAGTAQDVTARKVTEAELAKLHQQLLDASREAGMAEVATSVLHNVGNVLNSVNISSSLVVESVKKSKTSSLARVVVLLQEHAHDLGTFITQDSRGRHVPAHLAQLSECLQAEQESNVRELDSMRRNVDHIKEIVAMQQNYATLGGLKEMVNVVNLVEDGLRINEQALTRHGIEVIREFADVPPLNLEKHKILQILVNLLRNAKHACQEFERADKQLTVRVANGDRRIRISVIDNGIGIPSENLIRIFNHGFTTRKGGHGFGLHGGALAAKDLGGSLTVRSDGIGKGAVFTLELRIETGSSSS
jgi:PAS domain S-box-containing protein